MSRAREPEPATIRSHFRHFRTSGPPENPPGATPEGHPIVGWDVFVIGEQVTPCYAPVIRLQGDEVHASNRLWCMFCPKWVRYSQSVSHYTRHVQSHGQRLEQIRQLSDPSGMPFAILSFVLGRGEPSTALDFFRKFPLGEWLPTAGQLTRIIHILMDRLTDAMRTECSLMPVVNLAVDGWSDHRGRRYQGVTARLLDPRTMMVVTRLLAMKEITCVHESASELRAIVGRVRTTFGVDARTLNLCTDRCSMNEAAFRSHQFDSPLLHDQLLWLPCTCHILNGILSCFIGGIRQRLKPILRLQQRFRKCGPFLAYLLRRNAAITSIPSISPVRWYSSNMLFESLLVLWDQMVSFAAEEGWVLPELSETVQSDICRLRDLTSAFVAAQKDLESDDSAAASRFVPHLLLIRRRMERFREDEPGALQAVAGYIEGLAERYRGEWDVFELMTYLNPSLQWEMGRTCSETTYDRIRGLLIELVQRQLDLQPVASVDDPPSDDFFTPRGFATGGTLAAVGQVDHYHHIRTHGVQPLGFWFGCAAGLRPLSVVATNILSLLGTSASVERSFSAARQVCADYQMAMKQETVSARVRIRVNWRVAQPLLGGILALGRSGWARLTRAREAGMHTRDDPWLLGIVDVGDGVIDEEDAIAPE